MSIAEVLLYSAIISILFLAAYSQGSTYSQGSGQSGASLKRETHELVRLMRRESLLSLLEHRERSLAFISAGGLIVDTSGKIIYSLPKKIQIRTARFGQGRNASQTARYRESGIATPGSITLSVDGGGTCRIFQALRGAVRYEC